MCMSKKYNIDNQVFAIRLRLRYFGELLLILSTLTLKYHDIIIIMAIIMAMAIIIIMAIW